MVLNLSVPELKELKPKITVFGVGGAGGNAINNMIESGLAGVEFVAANTDAQALSKSLSDSRMQLGVQITKGLGAGSHPDIGKSSADETKHEIMERLEGTNMLFITAGMGGGTGTGAAPVIARVAKELGILTVAVVTKPFQFEGAGRMRIAEQGLKEIECLVDTTIVIPNQNLFRVADEKTTFADAFSMADEVLHAGVRSITDLMVVPGLINLDFADVKTIMNNMGRAMMGTGEASGENRAIECAHAAITNPLLDDYSLDGAKGLLINITGGTDLTLHEVDKITNEIREQVHPDADIIVGSIFDESLKGTARVSVVATGLDPHSKPTKSIINLQTAKNSTFTNSAIPVDAPRNQAVNAELEYQPTGETEKMTQALNTDPIEDKLQEEIKEEVLGPVNFNEKTNHHKDVDGVIDEYTERPAVEEEPYVYIDENELLNEEILVKDQVEDSHEEDINSEHYDEEAVDVEPTQEMDEVAAVSEKDDKLVAMEEVQVEKEAPAPSILDLISDNKIEYEKDTSMEQNSTPDLFTEKNVHEINAEKTEGTKIETEDEDEVETDQDLLEIPSFLRRQSK